MSFIDSGNTALTVAWVPTAMNAGVRMSPWGVWITPALPARPASSASTSKKPGDGAFTAVDSHTMRMVLALAAATDVGVAGCSAPPTAPPQPGTLVVGTAQVTVNDADAGSTDAVQCSVAGPMTTITT